MLDHRPGPRLSRGPRLRALIGHGRRLAEAVTADLRDPDACADLAALPVDAVAAQLRDVLATIDHASAAVAVLTGVVNGAVSSRQPIEGSYASTRRFLEVEAGMSEQSAKALTGRAHDLRDAVDNGDSRVRDAWLAGELTDDKVHVLTVGVRDPVTREPIAHRRESTRAALDLLLPSAVLWTIADLKRAVARIRFVVDPDGVRQVELDAHAEQSLTCAGGAVHAAAGVARPRDRRGPDSPEPCRSDVAEPRRHRPSTRAPTERVGRRRAQRTQAQRDTGRCHSGNVACAT